MYLLCLIALLLTTTVLAEHRRFELNISSAILNPDCHSQGYETLLINNQFLAPTIRVTRNDDVEVVVHNALNSRPAAIHFHGIRQYGTVESDGVPDITQASIEPGETYTYRFRVMYQSGTYYYHAHIGLQDDTIQGALIVHDDDLSVPGKPGQLVDGPYVYDGELMVHISEWWHQNLQDREDYYMGPNFVFDQGAESILINGKTIYNRTTQGEGCKGLSVLNVEPHKVYRLRVIGGNTFRVLGLGIKNHTLTIIEVDGELIKPYETSYLEVAPGQRFSVLLRTQDQLPGSLFPIATNYRLRRRGGSFTENGYAYLQYTNLVSPEGLDAAISSMKPVSFITEIKRLEDVIQEHEDMKDKNTKTSTRTGRKSGANTTQLLFSPDLLPSFPKNDVRDWIWPKLKPLRSRDPVIDIPASRTIKLRAFTVNDPVAHTRYWINGRAPPARELPIIHEYYTGKRALAMGLEPDGYNSNLQSYPVQFNETIDIVLQNALVGTQCLVHPWHTHGHSHYQISSGDGEYYEELHGNIRNFPHPLYKDVTTVYPTAVDNSTTGCGWAKIRLVADNPGFWAIHCHITTHMMQGKLAVLEVAPELIDYFKLYK
ncbi:hypothetical protein DFQ28_004959 [Apophysomyces sp. BC1034]|nr:hypothetical protein DFQ30_004897 [Apophysomyces sp. BC1015]KAG0178154.1 hypothetical protein DFQ29_003857 [Apophysomyces sp. BC1021]KAG0188359.1 hypothetical protein DFQ28_004959 [Apophysomyces sp. BC1034]